VAEPFIELPGLKTTLDKLVYQPAMQTPPDRPHCFVYFITIHNDSDVTVTIRGRKWVVTNDDDQVTVVEGQGVVGKTPEIAPGEQFSYNSFHLLDTRSGRAAGNFFGTDESGRRIMTRIPDFEMEVPFDN
jgi:ApaG protein